MLGSCAQVGELSGGEKDTTPPRLVRAVPEPFTTGFNGDRILLEFDERIALDRVRDRMLISPPLDENPDVRISGARSVTIALNGPLRANTTYTFGIGEAVKDLTEGNFASDLHYVVSTGDVLDSLWIAGTVVDAFSGAPEQGALVLLHSAEDTSTIRSGRPIYASRTKADGSFRLSYLRAGSYRIYALRDQNANYLLDLPNEEVAFLDHSIELAASDTGRHALRLRLFQERSKVLAVREVRVTSDGALRLVLSRPGERITLRDLARKGGDLHWKPRWNPGKDTVHLWPSDTTLLGQGRFEVQVDEAVLDTVRYRPVERMPFHTGIDAVLLETDTGAVILVHATRPIAQFDNERISIIRDSVPLTFIAERNAMDPQVLIIRTDLPPGSSGRLIALPKAIRDIYGGYNDTLSANIGRAAESSTGTLEVRIPSGPGTAVPLIVRLLDAQDRTVRSTYLEAGYGTVKWTWIRPGQHKVLAILDTVPNGTWDTGDPDAGTQPERVVHHPGSITIRAAWDLVIDLSVGEATGPVDGPAPLDR